MLLHAADESQVDTIIELLTLAFALGNALRVERLYLHSHLHDVLLSVSMPVHYHSLTIEPTVDPCQLSGRVFQVMIVVGGLLYVRTKR